MSSSSSNVADAAALDVLRRWNAYFRSPRFRQISQLGDLEVLERADEILEAISQLADFSPQISPEVRQELGRAARRWPTILLDNARDHMLLPLINHFPLAAEPRLMRLMEEVVDPYRAVLKDDYDSEDDDLVNERI